MANLILRPKYMVMKIDDNGETYGSGMNSTNPEDVDSPFVLMPRKDPAAYAAMLTYSEFCEPQLKAEIRGWLCKIARAKPLFGTQGERNLSAYRLRSLISPEGL